MTVQGKNVVLFIYDGGVWKGYACCTSVSFSVVTDFIETSVSGSGKNATFLPTKNSFTGAADGVVAFDEDGKLTLADFRQRQLAHQSLLVRFQRTDDGGEVYTDECTVFISSSDDTGSIDSMATFSIGLRGTGGITQIFTPQPPTPGGGTIVKRYPQIGSSAPVEPGTTVLHIPLLAGKDIIEVVRDGIGHSDIILSGTPVNKEVKYTSAEGDFEFAIPFEEENFYILYQDV